MDAVAAASGRATQGPPGGSERQGPPVRKATVLLRELLEVSDLFEAMLRVRLSVNPTDLEAMQHLIASGPLGPSELARRLGITTAAMTTSVDRLVALGHVTREPHPTDRRGIRVVPTESSRNHALGILFPMIMGVDAVLDGFTSEEQQVITDYLQRVVDVYRTHVDAPAD